MNRYLDRAFVKFGNTVHVKRNGQEETVKAFIQPLRRRHCLYLNERYISAEHFDNRHVLYIGPIDCPLSAGMRISCKGTQYTVVSTEVFTTHNESVYVWAILR